MYFIKDVEYVLTCSKKDIKQWNNCGFIISILALWNLCRVAAVIAEKKPR